MPPTSLFALFVLVVVCFASPFFLLLAEALSTVGDCSYPAPPNYVPPSASQVIGAASLYVVGTASISAQSGNAMSFVVTDNSGSTLYVSDSNNNRVLRFKIDPNGNTVDPTATLVFGQPDFSSSGYATSQNGLSNPTNIVITSQGHLYVVDQNNYRVVRYDNANSITTNMPMASQLLGQNFWTTINYGITQRQMYSPTSLAYDSVDDKLWVSDPYNYRILRFDGVTSKVETFAPADYVLGAYDFVSYGISAINASCVSNVNYMVFDSVQNRLYVAQTSYNRVLRFDNARNLGNFPTATAVFGQLDFTSSTSGLTQTTFDYPRGIAISTTSDTLFVSDSTNNRVLVFRGASKATNGPKAAVVLGQYDFASSNSNQGNGNPDPTTLYYPYGSWVDAKGVLWVTDTYNYRIIGYPLCPSATRSHSISKSKSRSNSRSKTKSKTKSKSKSKSHSKSHSKSKTR